MCDLLRCGKSFHAMCAHDRSGSFCSVCARSLRTAVGGGWYLTAAVLRDTFHDINLFSKCSRYGCTGDGGGSGSADGELQDASPPLLLLSRAGIFPFFFFLLILTPPHPPPLATHLTNRFSSRNSLMAHLNSSIRSVGRCGYSVVGSCSAGGSLRVSACV